VPYVHNAAAPGLGKIGVLVALEGDADRSAIEALGKQLAMHIAAASPQALTEEGLDAAVVERERASPWKRRTRAASRPTSSRRWWRARSPSSARKTA
jgi:translation elongation factor EF-Ts